MVKNVINKNKLHRFEIIVYYKAKLESNSPKSYLKKIREKRKCETHSDQLMTHFDVEQKKPACQQCAESNDKVYGVTLGIYTDQNS